MAGTRHASVVRARTRLCAVSQGNSWGWSSGTVGTFHDLSHKDSGAN